MNAVESGAKQSLEGWLGEKKPHTVSFFCAAIVPVVSLATIL